MSDRKQKLQDAMAALGLGSHPQSLINGVLTEGTGADVQLVDPFTEEVLLTYPDAGATLAKLACDAAQNAQVGWAKGISAAARGQVMQDIVRIVLANVEPLATIEAIVAGKPIRDCRIEVAKVAEMFAYYAGWADKLHGEVIPVPSGHLNYTQREPLGVVFQITPWNAPIFTAGWQIAPAIATARTPSRTVP